MHSRYITIREAKDIDAGIEFLREFIPIHTAQPGFNGVTVTADREGGLLGLATHWATHHDLDASYCVLSEARNEQLRVTGGVMTVETFEVTTDAIARSPAPGNPVIVTRVSMDPSGVDFQITRFERELMPAIAARRGFSCSRLMANRTAGSLVLGVVWQDASALKKHMEAVKSEREIAEAQGVRIDEVSAREILLINID